MLLGLVCVLLLIVQLSLTKAHTQDEPEHLSLPNLLLQDDLDRVALNWELGDDMSLSNGRLVSQNGALWSTPGLAGSSNEWTIEYVFRSNGSRVEEIPNANTNDLSFWLIADPLLEVGKKIDKYDGFRFAVNNQQHSGLKLFNNDGSKTMNNEFEESIGNCLFNYHDSLVPFTVRISYSRSRNWFKVQVDNNLCFKTDKIQIPMGEQDLKFGITTSSASHETWEIFKLNVWSHLTEDAHDDHGLMLETPVEVKAKQQPNEQPAAFTPEYNRESLMERVRKQQDALGRQGPPQASVDQNQFGLEILNKLQEMESKLQIGNQPSGNNKDVTNVIIELKDDLDKFKLSFVNYQSEMLNTMQKLNDKIISEVREHQYNYADLSKKVELILDNHKETSHKLDTQRSREISPSNVSDAIVYWILIPVVIGVIFIVVSIYRLRRDIKHSKLL